MIVRVFPEDPGIKIKMIKRYSWQYVEVQVIKLEFWFLFKLCWNKDDWLETIQTENKKLVVFKAQWRSRVDFLLFLLSAYNQQDYSTKDEIGL